MQKSYENVILTVTIISQYIWHFPRKGVLKNETKCCVKNGRLGLNYFSPLKIPGILLMYSKKGF